MRTPPPLHKSMMNSCSDQNAPFLSLKWGRGEHSNFVFESTEILALTCAAYFLVWGGGTNKVDEVSVSRRNEGRSGYEWSQ